MRITKQPKYGNKTTTEGEVVLIMSHCRKSLKSQNISFQLRNSADRSDSLTDINASRFEV